MLTGNVPWDWISECEEAFEQLKTLMYIAPVLILYDPEKECVMETNASDYIFVGIFSQPDKKELLCLIIFFFKKHLPAKCNYKIYNKELLAVILVF